MRLLREHGTDLWNHVNLPESRHDESRTCLADYRLTFAHSNPKAVQLENDRCTLRDVGGNDPVHVRAV